MFLLYKPFLMDGSHCGGKSFQVETKQPFLSFPLAMDPWKETWGKTIWLLPHEQGCSGDCGSKEAWVFMVFSLSLFSPHLSSSSFPLSLLTLLLFLLLLFLTPLPPPLSLDIIEFEGPLLLSAPCGSLQDFLCIKIPIVSLFAWVMFLTNEACLRDLCLFLKQTLRDCMEGTG